jgi:hypothetical protein
VLPEPEGEADRKPLTRNNAVLPLISTRSDTPIVEICQTLKISRATLCRTIKNEERD